MKKCEVYQLIAPPHGKLPGQTCGKQTEFIGKYDNDQKVYLCKDHAASFNRLADKQGWQSAEKYVES